MSESCHTYQQMKWYSFCTRCRAVDNFTHTIFFNFFSLFSTRRRRVDDCTLTNKSAQAQARHGARMSHGTHTSRQMNEILNVEALTHVNESRHNFKRDMVRIRVSHGTHTSRRNGVMPRVEEFTHINESRHTHKRDFGAHLS